MVQITTILYYLLPAHFAEHDEGGVEEENDEENVEENDEDDGADLEDGVHDVEEHGEGEGEPVEAGLPGVGVHLQAPVARVSLNSNIVWQVQQQKYQVKYSYPMVVYIKVIFNIIIIKA